MGVTMCPGQDTAFWKPGDIFEIECGECGNTVEFFKDDATRRCRNCGQLVQNPRLSLGCAQWCEHAKECLGYDPKEKLMSEGGESSLVDKLIAAMKGVFGDDQRRVKHALSVLERAKEIMAREGGNPKVILSAAVLHDIGIHAAEEKHGSSAGRWQEIEGPPIATRIMKDLGLEAGTIEDVCDIIAHHHKGGLDSLEFKVIWDADWLVNIPEEYPDHDANRLQKLIAKVMKTETGHAIALRDLVPAE